MQEQIQLPFKVAFGVVLRGFRIRLGRSLVTLFGIALGIAFLMSVLANLALRKGVRSEDRLRAEVRRMISFLTAETGPPSGRTFGLFLTGALNKKEARLLLALEKENLTALQYYSPSAAKPLFPEFERLLPRRVSLSRLGSKTACILLLGAGEPPALSVAGLFPERDRKVLAYSHKEPSLTIPEDVTRVAMERQPRPEEIARLAAREKQRRFRSLCLVVLSLLVTVIGISNAMLMSVSERFREIGTMKCLGALSAFIRRIFFLESGLLGIVGGVFGSVLGMGFSLFGYGFIYGAQLTLSSLQREGPALLNYSALCVLTGILLSVLAAVYPAHKAAEMIPANALRSAI